MKKIFWGLMIGGLIFGENDHSLSVNGSFGFGVKYIDINRDVLEYPKGFSYVMEFGGVGRLDENDVGGILNFSYDKLSNTDIKNAYVSLDMPFLKLEGGDVLLSLSDFTIKNSTIRGIKGDSKNLIFSIGQSKERIEPGSFTSGQYRQWLGVGRISKIVRNNTFGITYLQAEDDPSSVNLPQGKPIINRVLQGDAIIPLGKNLSFKSNLAFSEYDNDKRDKSGLYKNKAFLGGFDINFSEISFEGIYQYIEPNFYTAGNIGLDNDREGFELKTTYIPSARPITLDLGLSFYDDDPEEKKTNITKTQEVQIGSKITPKSFPSISIDYKRTKEKDNKYSPLKEAYDFSLGVSKEIRNIDICVDYSKSSSDNKESDEYDSLISSYSLNTTGQLTKKTSLSSSLSFTRSETGKIPKTKQDSSFYLLSLSYNPIQRLRITPSYNFSKTKENKGLILKESLISLSLDWYLSTKYQINLEYKNIDHKETDNNYKGNSLGIKLKLLF